MSAWRVGTEAAGTGTGAPAQPGAGAPGNGDTGSDPGTVHDTIDRLTKWIPGDVLALYVAAVTAFGDKANSRPSIALLVAFIVLSPLFVIGAAFAKTGRVPGNVVVSAVLAAVAFTIWSISVPFSGWQRLDFVNDNAAAAAIVAAVAGALFGFIAEGVTKDEARRRGGGGAAAPATPPPAS